VGDDGGNEAATKDETLEKQFYRVDASQQVNVRMISILQIRKLRALILRPDQTPEMTAFLGDYAPETLHLGAFKEKRLVGILTIMHQAPKEFNGDHPDKLWLLRGMATLPEVRGQGYGAALVRSGSAYVAMERGLYLWCEARESALGFYEKLGFAIRGERFELPYTGSHFRMWHEITGADAAYSLF